MKMTKRATQARNQASGNGETADLLSYNEAAEYLNQTYYWMVRRRSRGEIPYYKLGRRVMFKREDLDAYLADNFHPAADR